MTAGIAVATLIFGYGMFKGRFQALEDRQDKHISDDTVFHSDLDRKLSAQFKRIDTLSIEVAQVKSDLGRALSLEKAEDKFVSKDELMLHIKNLELSTKNTDVKVDKLSTSTKEQIGKIEGKLDDIMDILIKKDS